MTTLRRSLPGLSPIAALIAASTCCGVLLVSPNVSAGCRSDDDCRAGRLCQEGSCVYRSCEKDIDCPGAAICTRGACVPPEPGQLPAAPPPPTTAPLPPTTAPLAPSPGQATGAAAADPRAASVPPFTYVTPTTEPLSPSLAIAGVVLGIAGAIGVVVGIPLAGTADDTLDVCYQTQCREVDVTDTTQRDVGLAFAIPGAVLLLGGVTLVLVGGYEVQVQPSGEAVEPAVQESGSRLPELTLRPTSASARWRF